MWVFGDEWTGSQEKNLCVRVCMGVCVCEEERYREGGGGGRGRARETGGMKRTCVRVTHQPVSECVDMTFMQMVHPEI